MKAQEEMPPKVPQALEKIDLARMWLGHLAKGHAMRQGRQLELAELVGRLPRSPKQAARWKAALGRVRKLILQARAAPSGQEEA